MVTVRELVVDDQSQDEPSDDGSDEHATEPDEVTPSKGFLVFTEPIGLVTGHHLIDYPADSGTTQMLKEHAREHGVGENVVFTGQRSDVALLMAACDVFSLPSFEEPFGLVFAEAMAMGSSYGLDLKRMLDVISESPANFAALGVKTPLLLGQTSEVAFNIASVRKDLNAIVKFAGSTGVPIPVVHAALEKYERAIAQGHAEEDVAGLVPLSLRERAPRSGG